MDLTTHGQKPTPDQILNLILLIEQELSDLGLTRERGKSLGGWEAVVNAGTSYDALNNAFSVDDGASKATKALLPSYKTFLAEAALQRPALLQKIATALKVFIPNIQKASQETTKPTEKSKLTTTLELAVKLQENVAALLPTGTTADNGIGVPLKPKQPPNLL